MALSSKFFPLDHYDSPLDQGYKLLPFNFHRLSSKRYIVSNMVGEHLLVDREVLEKLVNGTVDKKDELYNEFKANHFLMDDDSNVAIDLLGLKYRTKQYPVSQFTSLHIFVITLRCDYTCKYCQVSRKVEGSSEFDMTEEMALKALDLTFQSPSKAIKIEFQGGEPLLNFGLIKFIVERSLEINLIFNKDVQFVITSNLTFLNDEVLRFCEKHNVYISTSLDGPAFLHNKNRPRPNKNGHFKTKEGINKIQNRLGRDKVSALMTATSDSLEYVEDIIDEYVSFGLNTIFLRPLSPYGFAIKTKQVEKYNAKKWMDFYKAGLDYILEINDAGYSIVEQYTLIVLKKILTPSNPGYVDLQSPSGAGISAVVYNYDGYVYASDEGRMLKEMGDEKFLMGNMLKDSYEEIFLSDNLLDTIEFSLLESSPQCSECGLQAYCGSDPVYHYATQGDVVGKKPMSFFCSKNMFVIEHIFELLEDPKKKQILLGWLG